MGDYDNDGDLDLLVVHPKKRPGRVVSERWGWCFHADFQRSHRDRCSTYRRSGSTTTTNGWLDLFCDDPRFRPRFLFSTIWQTGRSVPGQRTRWAWWSATRPAPPARRGVTWTRTATLIFMSPTTRGRRTSCIVNDGGRLDQANGGQPPGETFHMGRDLGRFQQRRPVRPFHRGRGRHQPVPREPGQLGV